MENVKYKILVIDDEPVVLESCRRILSRAGYEVYTAQKPHQALKQILEEFFDIVIVDLKMPKIDGMEVLQSIRQMRPETAVIMMTGHSSVQSAVEAMRLGAVDYVPKPFNPDELEMVVAKVVERQNLLVENRYLREQLSQRQGLGTLIGKSPEMRELFRQILKVAPTSATILIHGESGTGKELVAKTIHFNSPRSDKPFIVADCSTLAPGLLESELFGHVAGAFTGAARNHKGLFELADTGTLFLDEIATMPHEAQGKLLRVLESKEFKPVGGETSLSVDIRLIAATNQNLREMVACGAFREDLFYRLSVVPITIPPLRERHDDIEPLVWHFLHEFGESHGKKINAISPAAINRLLAFSWPGNVRELRNAVERLVVMATGSTITDQQAKLVMPATGDDAGPQTLDELKEAKKEARNKAVDDLERTFIWRALKRNTWNVSQAAREIGMQRTNLHALMKKHGILPRQRNSG
jgi:DNA-binding NtrC family response regulator